VESITTDFPAPDFSSISTASLIPNLLFVLSSPLPPQFFPRTNIFHFRFLAPEVTSHDVYDKIRAIKGKALNLPPRVYNLPSPGNSTPAWYVRVRGLAGQLLPMVRADDIPGLSIARVRVIFRLPEDFSNFPDPLSYVDWYKELQLSVTNVGMHLVSLSSRNHRQQSSIIPVTDIARSCHLIPVSGRTVPRTWSSDSVLDQCKSFLSQSLPSTSRLLSLSVYC
jgi:hypothetical protein